MRNTVSFYVKQLMFHCCVTIRLFKRYFQDQLHGLCLVQSLGAPHMVPALGLMLCFHCLGILLIFGQGDLHFHFALGPVLGILIVYKLVLWFIGLHFLFSFLQVCCMVLVWVMGFSLFLPFCTASYVPFSPCLD